MLGECIPLKYDYKLVHYNGYGLAVVLCQSQSQSSAAVTMQANEWHGIGAGIRLAGVDTLIYAMNSSVTFSGKTETIR